MKRGSFEYEFLETCMWCYFNLWNFLTITMKLPHKLPHTLPQSTWKFQGNFLETTSTWLQRFTNPEKNDWFFFPIYQLRETVTATAPLLCWPYLCTIFDQASIALEIPPYLALSSPKMPTLSTLKRPASNLGLKRPASSINDTIKKLQRGVSKKDIDPEDGNDQDEDD